MVDVSQQIIGVCTNIIKLKCSINTETLNTFEIEQHRIKIKFNERLLDVLLRQQAY